MESKSAGDIRSPLDPIHSNTMAKTISPDIIQRINKRDFRGISADIMRIEKLKALNREIANKMHFGEDYPIWIDDLYLTFQKYVPEHLQIQVTEY